MRKQMMFLILALIYYSGYSQIITINDKETNLPLEMVSVISENPDLFAVTNVLGQADVSAFRKAGKIEIRLVGFKTEIVSFSDIQRASFIIVLAKSAISMDEVVVSATRWNQMSKDIPNRIIGITSKEVELMNPQTSADLLGGSGEVFIQKSQQGGGSPMIRGFATNRLLYSIDGIRMNTAIFRGGNLQNVISIDPFATERVEVLFGPGSIIYGSDAIGGVMSFQTLTPQLSYNNKLLTRGKAVMRYSSANNEKTGHFDVNLGWKKWATVTSFSSNDFGDLRMGSKGPDEYLRPFYVQRQDSVDVIVTNDDPRVQKPSGYSQINLMQKFRYKPNEKWEFQYAFHYSATSEYSRYDRHIRYRKGLPQYGQWYYGPQKWMMNNLSITHNGYNKIYDQVTVRMAKQSFEESRIDRDINKIDRHIRIEEVDANSINLDFNKTLGMRQKLYYGLEAVYNDVTSKGIDENIETGEEASGPSRYPKAKWSSYAAYLNYQHNLSKKAVLQAGARFNQYKLDAIFDTSFYPFPYTTAKMNNSAVTGSLGIVLRPSEKMTININLSKGFRSPNVDDMGKVFDSEPGFVMVPNPDLSSEYAYNGELGLVKMFGQYVKFDITGYYTVLQNALVRRDFQLNGLDSMVYDGELSKVQAIQNAAVATVYGIQAGFDLRSPSGFGFSTDFNYQKGEEEIDDGTSSPSRHAPPWFGNSRLIYTNEKLNIQFYAIYSGEKKFDDLPAEEQAKTEIYAVDKDGNPWSPGWYTLNFKANYQVTGNLFVGAGLENISDQRYRPYSSGIVAPGRNFVLSLKAGF